MKFAWSNTRALMAGIALILTTNIVVLLGVAYNRSGEPESVLRMTERELDVVNWSWLDNENSDIELRLVWRVLHRHSSLEDPGLDSDWNRNLDWLNTEDLRALGFDVSRPLESEGAVRYYERALPRDVLFVLEYDGSAYQTALEEVRQRLKYETDLAAANPGNGEFAKRAKRASDSLEREERFASRLFLVGAGQQVGALRVRYPDRKRYAIVRGRLQLTISDTPSKPDVTARVIAIDIDAISVPHAYRSIVEPLTHAGRNPNDRPPRYEATVDFGHRLEPWISGLSLLSRLPS